ncbi:DUF3006 domain-containing protein [Cytobacillus horneckiae]|uniref:DUF3006 domain-containing protein n=1 Tax=Cytobacillus horneckiae TaxID=549687 RepID=A0A2N0ZHQ7_9BACI|nr:DUF3006 domain-containing protein [Cytobacillus horneckiae]MEC1157848.1 DUF3006 domain-containing protein [Cytobacillus horneckiae]MED2937227.1 DUF3006 domain-containing protein [Cytobacillus horneckiae]PKG29042.1 DUF3006 domain-containing protein [Cytobacillus horneckiae]
MYSAYFDRKEGNQAVILIESLKKQITVHAEKLPEDCFPGTWLKIELQDGQPSHIHIDKDKTEKEQAKTAGLLAKLQSKKGKSNYKK